VKQPNNFIKRGKNFSPPFSVARKGSRDYFMIFLCPGSAFCFRVILLGIEHLCTEMPGTLIIVLVLCSNFFPSEISVFYVVVDCP